MRSEDSSVPILGGRAQTRARFGAYAMSSDPEDSGYRALLHDADGWSVVDEYGFATPVDMAELGAGVAFGLVELNDPRVIDVEPLSVRDREDGAPVELECGQD
ncbi:hypothetical protein [Nocardia sp. N2S4-5]|uniref:hypothetical protein n=1 Tax=Nocardia sp. N2S4-5 TaxID=3351565 RepID=UPI0037D1AABA